MSIKAFKDNGIANIPVLKGEQMPFKGEICFSTVCPGDGWVECNGENGTVDTRETRLFGTPNDASLGQRVNDFIGRHGHLITEVRGVSFHQTYINDDGEHEIKVKDTSDYYNDVFSVDECDGMTPYTRSTTYYLKMWVYIRG